MILILFLISIFAGVCPTPAKILSPIETTWETGSIYEITFSDGCPRVNGKEALLSEPLREAVNVIRQDDNTAYGDFQIGYKYIPDEGLYIVNLVDEFVEL